MSNPKEFEISEEEDSKEGVDQVDDCEDCGKEMWSDEDTYSNDAYDHVCSDCHSNHADSDEVEESEE